LQGFCTAPAAAISRTIAGVLDLPHSPVLPGNAVLNSRQGVEIEYLVGKAG